MIEMTSKVCIMVLGNWNDPFPPPRPTTRQHEYVTHVDMCQCDLYLYVFSSLIIDREGGKVWMLGRQKESIFGWNTLILIFVFGLYSIKLNS